MKTQLHDSLLTQVLSNCCNSEMFTVLNHETGQSELKNKSQYAAYIASICQFLASNHSEILMAIPQYFKMIGQPINTASIIELFCKEERFKHSLYHSSEYNNVVTFKPNDNFVQIFINDNNQTAIVRLICAGEIVKSLKCSNLPTLCNVVNIMVNQPHNLEAIIER